MRWKKSEKLERASENFSAQYRSGFDRNFLSTLDIPSQRKRKTIKTAILKLIEYFQRSALNTICIVVWLDMVNDI